MQGRQGGGGGRSQPPPPPLEFWRGGVIDDICYYVHNINYIEILQSGLFIA